MVAALQHALYNSSVPNTLGYHWVKSCYGLWLPGDDRGHWSEAWDEQLGFIEPHMLHEGDPVRQRMAQERMKHPPVRLTAAMIEIVAETIAACIDASNGGLSIEALAIQTTHLHALIPYCGRDIHTTVKWLADRTTKAIHRRTAHVGPVWCRGKWCGYVYDDGHWQNIRRYIRLHKVGASECNRAVPM